MNEDATVAQQTSGQQELANRTGKSNSIAAGVRSRIRSIRAVLAGSGVLGLAGFVADVAGAFQAFTGGARVAITVLFSLLILVCITLFTLEKNRWSAKKLLAYMLFTILLAAPMVLVWLKNDSVRAMPAWAADVNDICARESTRVSSAFEGIRSAGADIVRISKPYQTTPPKSIAEFTTAIAEPMRKAFDASLVVDSSYRNVLGQINHLSLPDSSTESEKAIAWVKEYERLTDEFHRVYESLASYILSNNADEQIGILQDYVPQMAIYNKLTQETFDLGKGIGVESCI